MRSQLTWNHRKPLLGFFMVPWAQMLSLKLGPQGSVSHTPEPQLGSSPCKSPQPQKTQRMALLPSTVLCGWDPRGVLGSSYWDERGDGACCDQCERDKRKQNPGQNFIFLVAIFLCLLEFLCTLELLSATHFVNGDISALKS